MYQIAGRRFAARLFFCENESSGAWETMAWCAASFRRGYPDVRLVFGRRTLRPAEREDDMAESVYKVIGLIGTSKKSWEKAANAAVDRAGKSLRDLRVAEVVKLDLQLDAKGRIEAYRAKLNVSFKFED